MSDIDKLLTQTLKTAGDSFHAADVAAAHERFVKRRRRRFFLQAGAGVAVAAAAAIAIVMIWPEGAEPFKKDDAEPLPPATGFEVQAAIPVGDSPTSLVEANGSVWVANTGQGTVDRIDADTDRVSDSIPIDGRPDEIVAAGDLIFVSDAESGAIYEIDPSSGHVTPFQVVDGGARFDLVVSGTTIVALDTNTGDIHLVGGEPSTITCPNKPRCHYSDVAADDNESWALNGATGFLAPIEMSAGANLNRQEPGSIPDYEGSNSADFALGFERFWVTDGNGHLWVTDPETGDWFSHDIGFDIGDISVGDSAIWISASANDSTDGALLKVDPQSGEVAESLLLSGNPVDAAPSSTTSAVWVAQQSANTVSRIGATGDAPNPEPSLLGPPADVVLVYSVGGELFAARADGSMDQLTESPEYDYNPTIAPDGAEVVFESWDQVSRTPDLLRMRIADGFTTTIGKGRSPDFDGSGGLAYVDAGGKIVFQRKLAGEEATFSDPDASVGQVRWAAGGRFIFYVAVLGNDAVPVLRDVDTTGELEGADYAAPESESWFDAPSEIGPQSVSVLSFCCSNDPSPTQVELGEFDPTNPGNLDYRPLAELDGHGFDPDGTKLFTVSAGTLTVLPQDDGRVLWNHGDLRTWIVGDGTSAFLVNESGDVYRFPFGVDQGLDVNPSFVP